MTFSASWLALREPYDIAARNPDVLAAVVAALADRASVGVVDLASGSGSTPRAIASSLPSRQRWRLLDHDSGLLALAARSAPVEGRELLTVPLDIAREIETAFDESVDLVTASALLDLVSAEWLERLAVEVIERDLIFYAALSYDGRIEFKPSDPFDIAMIEAVNRHQRSDKGFGPALGPEAAAATILRFETAGCKVVHGPSDWRLGRQDREIQTELVEGWGAAAKDGGNPETAEIDGWLARRREHIALGRSSLRVGHTDLFVTSIGRRRAVRSQSNSTSPSSG